MERSNLLTANELIEHFQACMNTEVLLRIIEEQVLMAKDSGTVLNALKLMGYNQEALEFFTEYVKEVLNKIGVNPMDWGDNYSGYHTAGDVPVSAYNQQVRGVLEQ